MLRHAQAPGGHDALGAGVDPGRLLDHRPRDAREHRELLARGAFGRRPHRLETVGVAIDEGLIKDLARPPRLLGEHRLDQPLDEGKITPRLDGHVERGEGGGTTKQTAHLVRVGKAEQASLRQGVHCHDAGTPPHRPLDRSEHARVVRAGVVAEQKESVRALDVGELSGALDAAERLLDAIADA